MTQHNPSLSCCLSVRIFISVVCCLCWVSFSFFSFQSLSVPFKRPTDSTRWRERERERQTGRQRVRGRSKESARVRAFFGALGLCAHRNTVRAQEAWGGG